MEAAYGTAGNATYIDPFAPKPVESPTSATVASNQAQAAAMGVSIPGVGGAPALVAQPTQPTPPVTQPEAQPTMNNVYGNASVLGIDPNDPNSASAQNKRAEDLYKLQRDGLSPEQDAQARQAILAQMQAEIDAQNKVYADKLATAQVQGQGRLGSTTAIQARRGLLGSDFGATQTDTTNQANTQVYNALADQNAANISAIRTKGNAEAQRAVEAKLAAQIGGAQGYIEYLKGASERAKTSAADLAGQVLAANLDLSAITSDILSQYGTTAGAVKQAYETAKKAQETADQEAKDAAAKAELDALKTMSQIGLTEAQSKNIADKFTEDQRQFGLEYALKNRAAALSEAKHMFETYGGGSPSGSAPRYTPGENPTVDSWVSLIKSGEASISNVPAAYKNAVANAFAASDASKPEQSSYRTELATNGRQALAGLLKIGENNPGIFGRTAALPLSNALRSDAYRNYKAQLQYLEGNIIPASLTAMREASKTGGALGAVSDREGAWLASALGALSMDQSPEEAIAQLREIDKHLALWQKAVSESGGAGGQSSDSGQTNTSQAEADAAQYLDN